ncbi:porin [Caballeronia sp. GAWG2-1]|uniref:porin n=1 Tax=Caballeronia sp. GAWG2-1 TaxID=2921744 RepID=UPI002029183B|nr:porin [Caballeronia sp. GAWG2-1]
MKTRIIAGVALALLAVCQESHAQSSVTLYGRIDESLQYIHNTGGKSNQIGLQSTQMWVTRWGLMGKEDIGGGNKVIFKLESTFDLNNGKSGSSGSIFDRSAYVGVASDHYGTVTMGRQFDVLQDIVTPVQGNYYLEYFTTPGDIDLADGSIKANSAVKWISPSWDGLQIGLNYGFGGVAGSTGSGQFYAAAANYTVGHLIVAGGYIHSDNGNPVYSDRGTGSATGLFYTPVNGAYATSKAFNIARAGASYAIGPVTLGGYYSYSEYLPDGYSTFSKAERYNNGSVFAYWQATPSVAVEAGYDFLKSHGDSSATYHQASASASYSLSKATMVYASFAYAHASGTNGAGAAQAVIADSWALGGKSTQEMVLLGIAHQF